MFLAFQNDTKWVGDIALNDLKSYMPIRASVMVQ